MNFVLNKAKLLFNASRMQIIIVIEWFNFSSCDVVNLELMYFLRRNFSLVLFPKLNVNIILVGLDLAFEAF